MTSEVTNPHLFPLAEKKRLSQSNQMLVINTSSKQQWYHGDNYRLGDCVGLHSTGRPSPGVFGRAV